MQEFNRSFAVIIAIDQYKNGIPPLRSPVADARALAGLLQQHHGYGPLCLMLNQDASKANLQEFFTQVLPGRVCQQDRVFFYFAGHGIALDDPDGDGFAGYLLPQDAKATDRSSFLPMADVYRWLTALPCHHLLAVLDCCFAGAFHWANTREVGDFVEVLYQERYEGYIRDPAWQVITSAAYNERADDVVDGLVIGRRDDVNGAGHSPFAQALLDGLQGEADLAPAPNGDGVITASELEVYLRTRFEAQSRHNGYHQTPQLFPMRDKHRRGEYIFLAPGSEVALPPAPDLTAANNPYRGLKPFTEEQADLFFGRDEVLEKLRQHLESHALTVVLGPSGAGKSSLVRAGLLSRLRQEETERWHIAEAIRPGTAPMKRLAELVQAIPVDELDEPAADVGHSLIHRVRMWARQHPGQRLLLVVDQLEEIFTLCRDAQERETFLRQLLGATVSSADYLRLVLTLRSDFEPQLTALDLLAEISRVRWDNARFLVPLMTQDELRQVIERPAAARVIYFEPPELVDDLINEVVQMPGGLPLLSFTLSELYVECFSGQTDDRTITRDAYQRLGGVIGALQRRAGDELERLEKRDPALRETLRRMMLRMVSLEGGELARRRAPFVELDYEDPSENERVAIVRKTLVGARLLVEGEEADRAYVEPAHDALVTGWQVLRDWIDQEQGRQDDLHFQRRLTQAAMLWDSTEDPTRKTGLLWADTPRSSLLETILERNKHWLNATEARFARASIAQMRKNRRLRRMAITGLVVIAFIATIAALVAVDRSNAAIAQTQSTLINESQLLASLATQQLTEDPVASINLALRGLPSPESQRPYVPEAEKALADGLRISLERQFVPGMSNRAEGLAIGEKYIADANHGIRLIDLDLDMEKALPLSVPEGELSGQAIKVFWHNADTLIGQIGNRVIVWRTSKILGQQTFEDGVQCIESMPSVPQLAICSNEEVWLWPFETETRRHIFSLNSLADGARWSPDGRWLAAWDDSELVIWDADEERIVQHYSLSDYLTFFDWSRDSSLMLSLLDGGILAADYDSGAGVWSEELYPIDGIAPTTGQEIGGFALSPDGSQLMLFLVNGSAEIWDMQERTQVSTLTGHTGLVKAAAWRGDYVATASIDGTIRLWRSATGQQILALTGHTDRVLQLRWLPGGRELLSHSQDGTLRRWEVFAADGTPLCRGFDKEGNPHCMAHSQALQAADGQTTVQSVKWLDNESLITRDDAGIVAKWSLAGHRALSLPLAPAQDRKLAWNAPGDRVVAYQVDGPGQIWRLSSQTWTPGMVLPGPVSSVHWAGERRVLVSSNGSAQVIWLETGSAVPLVEPVSGVTAVAAQDNLAVIGEKNGALRLWDLETGHVRKVIAAAPGPAIHHVNWNAADDILVTSSYDGETAIVSRWDTQTWQPVWPFCCQQATLWPPAPPQVDPTGHWIATATGDQFYVLSAQSGEVTWSETLPGQVWGVQWSPDGSRLMTWGTDSLILWYVADRKQVLALNGNFQTAAISPDGFQVVTAEVKGELRVWQIWPTVDSIIEHARTCCLTRPLSEEQHQRFLVSDQTTNISPFWRRFGLP